MSVATPPHVKELDIRAQQHYDSEIKPIVEIDENIGKILVLDLDSGDYEISENSLEISLRMRDKHPNGHLYQFRIGYRAVDSFGGRLRPTKR